MTATHVPSTQFDSTQTIATRVRDMMTIDEFQKRGVRVGEVYIKTTADHSDRYEITALHNTPIGFGSVDYRRTFDGETTDSYIRHGKLTEMLYCWGYSLVRPEFAR